MASASIGGYVILRELARGASSRVFAVQHSLQRSQLALKLLEDARDKVRRAGLRREYRLLRGFEHAGMPKVLGMAKHADGRPYIVMQLLPDQNMRLLLRHRRDWVQQVYPVILRGVAGALAYLHARGVVHCDVKPENVVVGPGGRAWLVDFASARSPRDWLRFWEPVPKEASPSYIAPEQILGRRPQAQTDIYALAIMTFEVLAGRPPFTGNSVRALYDAHLAKRPPLELLADSGYPDVARALAHSLDKDADGRPAEVAVWAAQVAGMLAARPVAASRSQRLAT